MLEDKFKPYLLHPTFIEILELVKENSSGKIWIMGGFLYKNLARELYGGDIYDEDIDFVVEQREEKVKEKLGWNIYTNHYGVDNYSRGNTKMSFTDIRKAIRVSGMENPTIEKFIEGTPLNVQSIVYDIEKGVIIGEKGINALKNKIIAVNDKEQVEFYAQKKGKKVEDILLEKAGELGFSVV